MVRSSSHVALDALEQLPAAMLVVDARGLVRYANDYAGRLHGIVPGRMVGMPVAALLAPIAQLRSGCRADDGRGELVLADPVAGPRTLGYSFTTWTDLEGAELHAVLYQQIDNIEEIRTQRDRLLQLAAVGEVLPSVLHELRNPLAAVTTTLEVVIEEAPTELQRDLHAVLWELRRIGLGLQGIGGLNQQIHGHAPEAVDLAVQEACTVLASSARAVGATLSTQMHHLPLLPLDRAVLKGVVFNLVRNAIDACRPGDAVVVEAAVVDEVFELAVRDTGRGMTPEILARCTELFFTSKPNGSGIGLAICKQVARRAGGGLSIVSEPGSGTTVLVRIPLVPPGERPCPASIS